MGLCTFNPQVSWIGLFFVVRIVPGPYLFYKLCRGNYTAYNTFDSGLMMLTCPLPFMLNSYWRARTSAHAAQTQRAVHLQ